MILTTIFEKLAIAQKRYGIPILIAFLIFTVITIFGLPRVEMEGDISKEMPQDLPIYQLNNRIADKFSGQDTMMILVTLDKDTDIRNGINDIRDPKVMQYLIDLENSLNSESAIVGVTSLGTFARQLPALNDQSIGYLLDTNPALNQLMSRDYSSTLIMVKADIGSSQAKTIALTKLIDEKIASVSTPPGVTTTVTGTPSLMVMIIDLLASDAIYTLILASIVIFILLIVMEGSLTKASLIFIPLVLGLVWTMGTLGLLGIKISIATAGLGAMILGLGVEYGVFMLVRYKEVREEGKNQEAALKVSVPGVGIAILGSGVTTIVGFLALTLSTMPMMQHLGISLALGIFYCLLAALVVEPIIILIEEDIEYKLTHHMKEKMTTKHAKHKGMKR